MYPVVEITVAEIPVPLRVAPEDLYRIGEVLVPLRAEAVLIMGSGGVVHNLRLVHFEDVNHTVDSWATGFDEWSPYWWCSGQFRVTTASPLFTKA